MYPDYTGHLNVGTSKKAVAEWTFQSPFRSREDRLPHSLPDLLVKVMIVSRGDGIVFRAVGPCLETPLEDSDIEVLRKKVEEIFRAQHDTLTGVLWEDWLEVEIRGECQNRIDFDKKTSLVIKYSRLKRGVHPTSGKTYTVNMNRIAVPFPLPKKAGELDSLDAEREKTAEPPTFLGMRSREKDVEYSYVPATEENLAALEKLQDRLSMLRMAVSDFLTQDSVANSLKSVPSNCGPLAIQGPDPL